MLNLSDWNTNFTLWAENNLPLRFSFSRCPSPILHERTGDIQGGDGEIHREREPTLERTRSAGESHILFILAVVTQEHKMSTNVFFKRYVTRGIRQLWFMLSVQNWYFSTVSFFFSVHRSQMAHPLYQDPEPSEAKRRRKRLTQQAVQGKCLTYFDFCLTEAVYSHVVKVCRSSSSACFEGSLMQLHAVSMCALE